MWNQQHPASDYQTHTMTNNEILNADILDILFEKRNKDYGAYALRKSYDKRLLTALCTGLALMAAITAAGFLRAPEKSISTPLKKDSIIIREYVVPPKKVEKPAEVRKATQPKAVVKTAKAKLTNLIDIKKDELVKTAVTPVADLSGKTPGDQNQGGKPADGTVEPVDIPVSDNNNGGGSPKEPEVNFVAQERSAEFPGGPEALTRYLSKNLRTPGDLAEGEKKEVKVRFRVDADGMVNGFEIVSSGGPEFDKEVLRVCKKMPRWTPALQNGINVPVNYMIPVTFIGAEL